MGLGSLADDSGPGDVLGANTTVGVAGEMEFERNEVQDDLGAVPDDSGTDNEVGGNNTLGVLEGDETSAHCTLGVVNAELGVDGETNGCEACGVHVDD